MIQMFSLIQTQLIKTLIKQSIVAPGWHNLYYILKFKHIEYLHCWHVQIRHLFLDLCNKLYYLFSRVPHMSIKRISAQCATQIIKQEISEAEVLIKRLFLFVHLVFTQ